MTTPENATNIASYKWELLADGVATEGETVGTNSTLTLTKEMANKYIRVTVTDDQGTIFVSEAAPVTEDESQEVTIYDVDGLQADGTGLSGVDTLTITYGSAFGIPQGVTWYANGKIVKSKDFTGQAVDLDLAPGDHSITEGSEEVYAIVYNKAGEGFQTNSITMTATQQPVTVSNFSIVNDYETEDNANLSFLATDAKAYVTFTLSKNVDGDLYFYKDSVTKYGSENKVAKFTIAEINAAEEVDAEKDFTVKNCATLLKATAADTGICYQYADGSVGFIMAGSDATITSITFSN